MAPSPEESTFDTLTSVFDEDDLACERCGYFDDDGAWDSRAEGSAVVYEHVCPGCGASMTRTIEPR